MRRLRWAGAIAVLLAFVLSGCKAKDPDDPKLWQTYIPPDRTFTIKSPKPPEMDGYGYNFYGMDMRPGGLKVVVRVAELPVPNAAGVTQTIITPEQYEAGYRAESGATVVGKDINNGTYKGREIDITAGQRAPLVVRIFQANGHQYWLEWNPTNKHSTELADTFTIP
jgi:hypothetical protein